MSRWFWPAALTLVLASAATCGGKSGEQAKTFCDQEKAAKSGTNCITDTEYNACIQCYEDCGDNCRAGDICPETFTCK